jgi:hypothetical protein
MKKGENYAMIHLYGPEIHFGVTDKLSLGVMATWIASPIAVAAKYSIYQKENTSVALGSILGSSGYLFGGTGFFGLHWLTATKGKAGKNISLSAGLSHFNLGDTWGQTVGSSYTYSVYESEPDPTNYRVLPSYNAYYAVDSKLATLDPASTIGWRNQGLKKNTTVSAVIGLAGIMPIGKKASLFFDAMVFVSEKQTVKYSDYNITVDYENDANTEVTETFTIGKGEIVNNGFNSTSNATAVLMPGMRFHRAHNQAFQVALAGVIYPNGSFPIPMVSWLRQF